MLHVKDEPIDEARSHQADCGLSQPQRALASQAQDMQRGLRTLQKPTRVASGQKRTLSQGPQGSDRCKSPRTTRRDLFKHDKEQETSSAVPLMPECSVTNASHEVQVLHQTAGSPPAEAKSQHSPTVCAPASNSFLLQTPPVVAQSNVSSMLWSQLLGRSAQVLHARLSSYKLLPDHTVSGQQLLQLEAEVQSLLGLRQSDEGDADNVCWVDNGLLLHPEGVKSFAITYGDAECTQVIDMLTVTGTYVCG